MFDLIIPTISARAEISDDPLKGGLKRAGPNDFMFVYNLVQRDLSISMLLFLSSDQGASVTSFEVSFRHICVKKFPRTEFDTY